MHADTFLIRTVFSLILIIAGYLIHPIPSNVAEAIGLRGESGSKILSTIFAALIAAGIIYFELRIRRASLKTLIGAAVGSTMWPTSSPLPSMSSTSSQCAIRLSAMSPASPHGVPGLGLLSRQSPSHVGLCTT